MRHDIKYTEKMLEISQRLALKREDIEKIMKTDTSYKTSEILSPVDCYKVSGGYYGTISIKHFK